jgi:hypothetical protein
MAVLLVLIGLVVLGIERNNARNRYPRSWLSGSATATDRDAERMSADFDATLAHETPNPRRRPVVATRIPSVR